MSEPPIDDGGTGDDEPTLGGPPHPMDRIWRHPSELPSIADQPARARTRLSPVRLRSILAPLGAGAVGALLTVAALSAAGAFDQHPVTGAENRPTAAGHTSDAISTVAARVAPAIVAVRVLGKSGSRTGSGVCIRHAGQVLTSARLIAGATRIELVQSDGTVRTAHVMGTDPASDLALLSTDGDLEAADLAAPGSLKVGDSVYAVGADSTGTPWVSAGIVSSLDTRVADGSTTMTGLIQSNAFTEPAVAGGALLDSSGRVAGIVMTPLKGQLTTIVPIRLASRVADDLRANGYVDHGWLGLSGKVSRQGQLVVTAIARNGPSANAGIEVGDVIVNADSQPITTMADLMAAARGHWPGERIDLELTRDRSDWTVSVLLADMPPATTASTPSTLTLASATPTTS
jgi:S1-C subfamily serine protease